MRQQFLNDEFTSSVSVSSHQASANAPADFVIQAMLKDLHVARKCFSGARLVEWVKNYVRNNGYDNLGVCIGSTETDTGLELGQLITSVPSDSVIGVNYFFSSSLPLNFLPFRTFGFFLDLSFVFSSGDRSFVRS